MYKTQAFGNVMLVTCAQGRFHAESGLPLRPDATARLIIT